MPNMGINKIMPAAPHTIPPNNNPIMVNSGLSFTFPPVIFGVST